MPNNPSFNNLINLAQHQAPQLPPPPPPPQQQLTIQEEGILAEWYEDHWRQCRQYICQHIFQQTLEILSWRYDHVPIGPPQPPMILPPPPPVVEEDWDADIPANRRQ